MEQYLNSYCECLDIRHSTRCNHPGTRTYDTLSGYTEYICGKNAHWHDQPVHHGEVCQNLCLEHARKFRKIGRNIQPYRELVGKIEDYYVSKSIFSVKSYLFLTVVLGYVAYTFIRY